MSHQLDGCFERLDRAEDHLATLKAGFIAAESEVNDSIFIKPHLDLKRNRLTAVVAEDVVLPVRTGVIFGDIIHNLHAALDNLAFELGRLDGKTPENQSCFPIETDSNEWFTERVGRALAYIRPQDRARIESHQPFMGRNNVAPKHNVLARIKRYSNAGKHRVITPLGGVSMGLRPDEIIPTGFVVTETEIGVEKALRKDAVVGSFGIKVTGPDPNVSMKGRLPWYPSLDNGDPAEQFVKGAIAYLRDLMDEFKSGCF